MSWSGYIRAPWDLFIGFNPGGTEGTLVSTNVWNVSFVLLSLIFQIKPILKKKSFNIENFTKLGLNTKLKTYRLYLY